MILLEWGEATGSWWTLLFHPYVFHASFHSYPASVPRVWNKVVSHIKRPLRSSCSSRLLVRVAFDEFKDHFPLYWIIPLSLFLQTLVTAPGKSSFYDNTFISSQCFPGWFNWKSRGRMMLPHDCFWRQKGKKEEKSLVRLVTWLSCLSWSTSHIISCWIPAWLTLWKNGRGDSEATSDASFNLKFHPWILILIVMMLLLLHLIWWKLLFCRRWGEEGSLDDAVAASLSS